MTPYVLVIYRNLCSIPIYYVSLHSLLIVDGFRGWRLFEGRLHLQQTTFVVVISSSLLDMYQTVKLAQGAHLRIFCVCEYFVLERVAIQQTTGLQFIFPG